MREATNVSIDRENMITPARGFDRLPGFSDPTVQVKVHQLYSWNNTLVAHYDYDVGGPGEELGVIGYNDGEDWIQIGSGYFPPDDMPKIRFMQAGESLYWTTNIGIYVLDSLTGAPKIAGGVQALAGTAALSGTSGFMPPDEQRSYRLLWVYEDATGRLIRGTPSSRMVVVSAYKNINVGGLVRSGSTVTATFPSAHGFSVGDVLLLSPGETQNPVSRTVNAGQMSRTGSTVTVNTNGAHGYVVGQTVVLTPGETNFGSGTKTIATVPTSTSFTYTEAGAAVASTALQTFTATSGVSFAGGLKTVTSVPTPTTLTYTEAGLAGSSTTVQGMAYPSTNASVTFPVPAGVTVNYEWQLYRTYGSADANTEPDDNHYLVATGNPTTTDLSAGTITVLDIRPDSLMQDALYTNPNQEGIQNANEPPPLAKDMTVYKDTAFYANVRGRHFLNLTLLATGGSTGVAVGTSVFIVKNDVIYQFLGTDSSTGTESGASATKLGTFKVYLGGTPSQNIYDTATSLTRAINLSTDLNIIAIYASTGNSLPGSMFFQSLDLQDEPFYVYTNNMPNAWQPPLPLRIEAGTLSLGRNGGSTVTFRGDRRHNLQVGQTVELAAYPVKNVSAPAGSLSRNVSTVTATIPTGHSFVKNQVVTATAVGTPDTPFPNDNYRITDVLGPTQFTYSVIDGMSTTATSTVEYVFTSGLTNPDFPTGVKTVSGVPDPFTFTYVEAGPATSISNPYYAFVTDTEERVISEIDTYLNGLVFSKPGEFWAFPLGNLLFIGDESEPILRVLALREAVFVLKTDGVWRVVDASDGTFIPQLLDSTINSLAPEAACVFNNNVMALTTQGVVAIADAGGRPVSRPIETTLLTQIARLARETIFDKAFMTPYESDRKVFLWMPDSDVALDDYASSALVYNSLTNAWVSRKFPARCAIVNPPDNRLYVGFDDVYPERKDLTNKDFIGPPVKDWANIDILTVASNLMSFTHNMGPGYFKVGDIMYLGDSEVFWRNVIDYAVVAQVDDDTSTVVLDRALVGLVPSTTVQLLKGYDCTVRWQPLHGGDPTSLKQFSEGQFFYSRVTVPQFDIYFSTDHSPGLMRQILQCPNYQSNWGVFPWGRAGWGDTAAEATVGRLYVPTTKQRGHVLYVAMHWTAQAAYAEWQGIGIEGRAYTSTLTQR